MNRIFGYGNKKTHEQLLQESNKSMENAQGNLAKKVSQLDTQISQINFQLQTLQRKIKNCSNKLGEKPLRMQALKLINKRKQLEKMRDSIDSQSWTMQQAQLTNDNLTNTMITVNALKQTNKSLKMQYGKIDIDKIQDMQDEMLDLMEQSNELQDVLASTSGLDNLDSISDSELDQELNAIEDTDLFAADSLQMDESGLPSYLSAAVPNFIDTNNDPEQLQLDGIEEPLQNL